MADDATPRPLHVLVRNLMLVVVLSTGLYVLFVVLQARVALGLTPLEVMLIEAAAVVVVAYATARALTSASDVLLRQEGQIRNRSTIRIFLTLVVAVGALLTLAWIGGVSIESIFLGSAFAAIILGLAAQTVLSNVFAGILLVFASPFRPGDRVSLVSSNYGALAPSYPHELLYPAYTGVIEDVGLLYTALRLDTGGLGKVPNSVVIGALVTLPSLRVAKVYRVRMTFPLAVDTKTVEAALTEIQGGFGDDAARAPPRLEVTDISPTSWDGVVLLSTRVLDEGLVRDRVMRAVLRQLPAARSS